MNITALTSTLVAVTWIAVIIGIVILVMRASRNQPTSGGGRIVLILVLVAVLMTVVSAGLVFVNPQERAIVISAVSPEGYRQEALEPGLHWIIPFLENVVLYPISRQTYTMAIAPNEGQIQGDDSVTARTADGQEIFIDASVIYQIDPDKIVPLHINWQNRYSDELVRPQARGIIRDIVAQYSVDEVISTKRLEMIQEMNERMTEKLSDNGLILIDFVLRNITFSPEYAASVEQKQIAEQQALQAKFVVESKRQEAEQARQAAQGAADAVVIRAKGDAESRLISAEAEAKSLALIAAGVEGQPGSAQLPVHHQTSPNLQVMLRAQQQPLPAALPRRATANCRP